MTGETRRVALYLLSSVRTTSFTHHAERCTTELTTPSSEGQTSTRSFSLHRASYRLRLRVGVRSMPACPYTSRFNLSSHVLVVLISTSAQRAASFSSHCKYRLSRKFGQIFALHLKKSAQISVIFAGQANICWSGKYLLKSGGL